MGNATLLDVFQGAVGVTNQALGIYSQEKKHIIENQMYEAGQEGELLANQLSQDLLKVDTDGNNPYQANPQLYRDYVNKEIQKWKDRTLAKGNNSPYFNERFRQLELNVTTEMGKKIYSAQIAAERQQFAISQAKVKNDIANDENLAPEQKLERLITVDRNSGNLNDSVGQYNAERESFITAYKSALSYNDDGKATTQEAQAMVGSRAEQVEKYARETLGMNADEIVENKNELIDDYKRAAVKTVQERNYNDYQIAAERYSWLVSEVRNKSPGYQRYREEAIQLYREGNAEKRKGVYSSEYASGDWDAMEREFRWDDALGMKPAEGSGGGGRGRKPDLAELDSLMLKIIEGDVAGTSGRSFYDTAFNSENALEPLWKNMEEEAANGNVSMQEALQYYNSRGGKAEFFTDWTFNLLQNHKKYFTALGNSTLPNAVWFYDTQKMLQQVADDNGYKGSRSLTNEQLYFASNLLQDILFSSKGLISEKELRERGLQAITQVLATTIPGYKGKADAKNVQDMLKRGAAIANDRHSLWYFGRDESNVNFANARVEAEIKDFQQQEQILLQNVFNGQDFRFVKYQQDPKDQYDIIGLGIYENTQGDQFRISPDGKFETRERDANGKFVRWHLNTSTRDNRPNAVNTARRQQALDIAETRETWTPTTRGPQGYAWGTRDEAYGSLQFISKNSSPPVGSGISKADWDKWAQQGGTEGRLKKLMEIYRFSSR